MILPPHSLVSRSDRAFTLIELSIVLVVIGLLAGGVLVGQSLIKAAEVRAQVSQLEKFQSAVATFYEKYGGLPGDLNAAAASQFGFSPRGPYAGEGDGNGVLQGIYNTTGSPTSANGHAAWGGEVLLFWLDLSQAGLIEGNFTLGTIANCCHQILLTQFSSYYPQAKIGNGNYIYVWSGQGGHTNNINFFGISVPSVSDTGGDQVYTTGLTVAQAYAIDAKIDDGLPQSGNVLAYIGAQTAVGGQQL